MKAGELLIAYVWWEGQPGWISILSSNNWPPNTNLTTAWKVRNTGNEAAFFKVRFMGLTSAGALLSPGGEATLYLYPVTPGPGTYNYTLDIIADTTVVRQYPFGVFTGVVPVPEYKGSVTKKELEYNESRGIIPVSGVLQNKRGLFHVTARNDMSTSQPIGIYWFINDPDGLIAEEYTDWKFGTLGPGQTHEFIGDRFTFSKVGKYGTWIDLLMGSKDSPVVIYSARYIGELCTVGAPEYKGSIARKELEYDSVRGTIPVY